MVRKRIDGPVIITKSIYPTQGPGGWIDDVGAQREIRPFGQVLGAGGTGHLIFALNSGDTLKLIAGRRYFYDLQVKTDSGKVYTLELGRLTPLPEITRA